MHDVRYNRARRRKPASRKLIGWGVLATVGLIILGVFLLSHQGATPEAVQREVATAVTSPPAVADAPASTTASPPPVAPAASIAASEPQVVDLASMDQPARRAFVLKLISQGVFTGVQATTSPPKVGVTPLFQALSIGLKQQFIAAVDAYVHNGSAATDPLQIIDATMAPRSARTPQSLV